MATKCWNLNKEIERTMEVRSTQAAGKVTREMQNKTKGYKSNVVSIRFDAGDYERLREIAQEQGTNGAALIRKAVKDIIKAADRS